MIRITAGPEAIRFAGHAGYAPAGQDIVCAAVSALYYTLTENLRGRPGYVCRQDGDGVEIRCPGADVRHGADGRYGADVRCGAAREIGFVLRGLRAIAAAYPEYVQITTEGGAYEQEV